MKKIIGLFFAVLFSAGLYAQEGVIKFLGIPVDGTKQEMIQKLKSKGFTFTLFIYLAPSGAVKKGNSPKSVVDNGN